MSVNAAKKGEEQIYPQPTAPYKNYDKWLTAFTFKPTHGLLQQPCQEKHANAANPQLLLTPYMPTVFRVCYKVYLLPFKATTETV